MTKTPKAHAQADLDNVQPAQQPAESVFSLTYRSALPEMLRQIADELERGSAIADHFSSSVGRESFELRIVIRTGVYR